MIKITIAKKKSKSIFTGLQERKPTSSRPNYNHFFLPRHLPGKQLGGSATGRGLFSSRAAVARGKNLPNLVSLTECGNSQFRIYMHPAIKWLFSPKEFQKFPQAGHLRYFLWNWKKLTSKRPSILDIVKG